MNVARAITIIRNYRPIQTLGEMFVLDAFAQPLFKCFSLELPWRDNQSNISCIPEGRYVLRPRYSDKYKNHLHVLDVPNREWILIHPANYVSQLRGCIAVGRSLADINNDGVIDITSSVATKNKILEFVDGDLELIITS